MMFSRRSKQRIRKKLPNDIRCIIVSYLLFEPSDIIKYHLIEPKIQNMTMKSMCLSARLLNDEVYIIEKRDQIYLENYCIVGGKAYDINNGCGFRNSDPYRILSQNRTIRSLYSRFFGSDLVLKYFDR